MTITFVISGVDIEVRTRRGASASFQFEVTSLDSLEGYTVLASVVDARYRTTVIYVMPTEVQLPRTIICTLPPALTIQLPSACRHTVSIRSADGLDLPPVAHGAVYVGESV